ncbi:STAS domain-containing protein [Plantactinospora sp. KLBMP9567]|uniref:STAS domain-containing protein n=1 Tax=Plantactinospora sp. KLBMP9567 TaxID=3085900 RepID=UPI003990B89F
MAPNLSPVTALAPLPIDTSHPQPATARLGVAGEIDLATAPVLRDKLLTLLRDQTPAVLVVDLAGVAFLDCAGIGALVGVRNAAGEAGCELRVTDPQPFVRRVLEVTGLLGIFTAPIEAAAPSSKIGISVRDEARPCGRGGATRRGGRLTDASAVGGDDGGSGQRDGRVWLWCGPSACPEFHRWTGRRGRLGSRGEARRRSGVGGEGCPRTSLIQSGRCWWSVRLVSTWRRCARGGWQPGADMPLGRRAVSSVCSGGSRSGRISSGVAAVRGAGIGRGASGTTTPRLIRWT